MISGSAKSRKGGTFGPPAPLSLDKWMFDGCPHDGPSLVVEGDSLHAVWISAHSGKNRVYAASCELRRSLVQTAELSPASAVRRAIRSSRRGLERSFAVWDESLDAAWPRTFKPSHGAGHGPSLSGSGRAVMFASGGEAGFHRAGPVRRDREPISSTRPLPLDPMVPSSSSGARSTPRANASCS